MSHITKINGTNHEINSGKVLRSGTAYNISSGKTLVGGTSKSISFGITDLTDTYWKLPTYRNLDYTNTSVDYDLQYYNKGNPDTSMQYPFTFFVYPLYSFKLTNGTANTCTVKYYGCLFTTFESRQTYFGFSYGGKSKGYSDGSWVYSVYGSEQYEGFDGAQFLHITGGSDVQNPTLLNFFNSKCTQCDSNWNPL